MQYSLNSQRQAHIACFLGPRIITTHETTPRPSLSGGLVSHYYLKGIHVQARVIKASRLARKGLIVDSQHLRSEHERRNITAAILKPWREQDVFTYHLSQIAGANQLIPPASHFISIGAASPFFRTEELKVYHKDLAEVPWTEESFLPTEGGPLLDEPEIREGSFIHFYDPSLTQETRGADSPQLFCQIHQFIGYTPTHVAALIDILTFYRFGQLMSYITGETIHPGFRLVEQTIVLIARSRCRFEIEPTLEFKPADVELKITYKFLYSQKLVSWGPKRDWPNRADWERELRKTVEEGNRESRGKVWGRKEAVKRGV